MQSINWDDLRYCLTVVREGTVSAASRRLDVNHTTVSRRITALETELHAKLFDRSTTGWLLTPFGEGILRAIEAMDEDVNAIRRQATADAQDLRGRIRVTAPDTCIQRLLLPGLSDFAGRYPEIEIELIASDTVFNLAVHEADMAFRATDDPPPNVLGTRVGTFAVAVYGTPTLIAQLQEHPDSVGAITWTGGNMPQWISRCFPGMRVRYFVNSLAITHDLARAGMGLALLPCGLGDTAPELQRLPVDHGEPGRGFWVLSHIDLRTTARLRIFRDFMLEAIAPHLPLIEGKREHAWRDPLYAANIPR